jgi:alpha-N-arabinofuranosidase
VADTLVVLVDCQPWERVDDLAVVGTGRYYQLDPSTGEVLFGDGRHGAIPPAGAIVEATYVAGPRAGFADFYQAMKAADPNIRVGSCVYSPRFFELMGDRHPYDFVTVHHYSPVSDLDFEVARRKMWRASAAIAESVDIASELRDRFAGARAAEIEVLVTEWNVKMWGRVREPVSGYFRSLDHGLFVASALNHLIARGVPAANIHDLVELPTEGASATGKSYDSAPESGVFEPAPSYRPRPAALVMSLYARHMVGDRVEATVAGEVVEGDTPMVEVCAARDERGRLVVMLLNRDPDREARVVVSPGVSAVGPAAVWRVEADGGGTATEARVVEDRVVPRGGVLTLVVPRTSLTCVEVAPLES